MKRLKIKNHFFFGVLTILFLLSPVAAFADDAGTAPEKAEELVSKSTLDNLKAEWEAVREQQIQMIREKEEQLEKLKEEIFAKMKALNAPVTLQPSVSQAKVPDVPGPALSVKSNSAIASGSSAEFETQKAALQAERQKFFQEMSRQKESLLRLQSNLDKKAKELETERARFEQEKKTAAR